MKNANSSLGFSLHAIGGLIMNRLEFASARKGLKKSKKELSHLLGIPPRIIRSYEKGRESIPDDIEKQLLSLTSLTNSTREYATSYWQTNGCSTEDRLSCPAWKLKLSHASWSMDINMGYGIARDNWPEKMCMCRSCDVLKKMI